VFFTRVGDTFFFTAMDAVNDRELWKTDGTEAGTVLVKDIWPGTGTSFPPNFTRVGGTLFFAAADPVKGCKLWSLIVGMAGDASPDDDPAPDGNSDVPSTP
jgi:ELWxxDGT repeat protein